MKLINYHFISSIDWLKVLLTLIALIFMPLNVFAEQTIISVPSSDVLPAKKLILKDSNKFGPFSPGKYASITPTVTVGLGHNMEASAGVSTKMDGKTRVKGDFAIKKVFFLGKRNRLTIGTRVVPYLAETTSPNNFTYAHFSTRLKTRTTLTSGVFVAANDRVLPNQPGAILGLEQVLISNKLRLALDWTSRNENYGLLTAGLKYRPTPTTSMTTAVLIPNGDNGEFGFVVSISKFIDTD